MAQLVTHLTSTTDNKQYLVSILDSTKNSRNDANKLFFSNRNFIAIHFLTRPIRRPAGTLRFAQN